VTGDVAAELDKLRVALGEVDALATLTAAAYDAEDWIGSDPLLVDRIASLLGLLAKSATTTMEAFHRLHGAIADARPAPTQAGVQWDYSEGTAPGPGGEGR
jgi:hypothetical protein